MLRTGPPDDPWLMRLVFMIEQKPETTEEELAEPPKAEKKKTRKGKKGGVGEEEEDEEPKRTRPQGKKVGFFYGICRTAGYISGHCFLFDLFVYFFFTVTFLSSHLQRVFRLNNQDFNIDQNNHDYDFLHNQAALVLLLYD